MSGVPSSLRGQWWLTTAAFALAATGVAAATALIADRATAGTWLAASAVPLAYASWTLRRGLPSNRPPEETVSADGGRRLYPTLGLANGLTLTRGWLYAGLAGFLLVVPPAGSGWRWVPALWYGVGVTLDRLDGLVARTVGRPTVLGARLDLAFDTMGFLLAPLVAVAWGRLPVWYLSVSAARYVYKFGCWSRRRRGLSVGELPSSALRRPLAALQMTFITVALVPAVPTGPLRAAAAVVLVPSLAVFLRDYLVVAGHAGEANDNEPTAR